LSTSPAAPDPAQTQGAAAGGLGGAYTQGGPGGQNGAGSGADAGTLSGANIPRVLDFDDPANSGAKDLGDVNPMASEDPLDYFSRTSAKDNLFKIVERRYHLISIRWAEEDLHPATRKKAQPAAKAATSPKTLK
jgi:hypothetical protein